MSESRRDEILALYEVALKAEHFAENTRRAYLGRVRAYLGWLWLGDADLENGVPDLTADYLRHLTDLARKRSTINGARDALRHFFLFTAVPDTAGSPADDHRGAPVVTTQHASTGLDTVKLTGRATAVTHLRGLVRRHRLVTITGGLGIGKSQVARRVAADAHGSGMRVFGIDLDSTDGTDVLDRILRFWLEVSSAALESGEPERTLVLLDNVDHCRDQIADRLMALISQSTRVHFLTTGREPLQIYGEVLWKLAPLQLPDPGQQNIRALAETAAVALFVRRAREAQPQVALDDTMAGGIRRIVENTGGYPLAIELAAAGLRHHSLEQIVSMVRERDSFPSVGGRGGAFRHRSLAESVVWSTDGLTPHERRVLARLSVFSHGFGFAAAASICAGLSEDDESAGTEAVVYRLLTKSLLVADRSGNAESRLSIPPFLRRFFLALGSSPADTEQAMRQLRNWVVERAEVAVADASPLEGCVVDLGVDIEQARAIWLILVESGDSDAMVVGIALSCVYRSTGEFGRGLEVLTATLRSFNDVTGRVIIGFGRAAVLAADLGRLDDALILSRHGADLAERHRTGCLSEALLAQSHVHAARGDLVQARLMALHAVAAISDLRRDSRTFAQALTLLACIALQAGDLPEATRTTEQAREIHQDGPASQPSRLTLAAAGVMLVNGNYAAASRMLEDLLVRHRSDAAVLVEVVEGLAIAHFRLGHPERATRLLTAGRRLREDLGMRNTGWWQSFAAHLAASQTGQSNSGPPGSYRSADGSLNLDEVRNRILTDSPPWTDVHETTRAPLSVREWQIAQMIGGGMSLDLAAEHAGIAGRTAESHLESVRRKLNLHTRRQIAEWLGSRPKMSHERHSGTSV